MNFLKLEVGRYDFAAAATFIAYAGCSIVLPVAMIPAAKDLGFALDAGGQGMGGALHLGRSMTMVAAMIACGFVAGRFGLCRSLGWSMLSLAFATLLVAIAPSYGLLFAGVALAGLGEGMAEGLTTPLVQNLHPEQPGKYMNFAHGFWALGILCCVLIAGGLLTLGMPWRWVVGLAGITAIFPAVLFLIPNRNPKVHPDSGEILTWKEVLNQSVSILKVRRFWLFFVMIFLAGGGDFSLTFWVASFVQLEYGGSAMMGGLGTACFAAGMASGRIGGAFWVTQERLPHLIVLSSFLALAVTIFFPLLNSLTLLFVLLFFAGVGAAPLWPCIQTHCAQRLPNLDATMIFVILSCAGIPGCGFFAWLMGVAGDHFGLRHSFFIIPGCFFLIGCLMVWEFTSPRQINRQINYRCRRLTRSARILYRETAGGFFGYCSGFFRRPPFK